MAQGEGFKHITVTAPEEDDVVIVAGSAEAAGVAAAAVKGAGGEDAPEAPAEQDDAASRREATPPGAEKRRPARPGKAESDYRETTLQDLEPTPMPLAQRIVIAAAIICIIGAVIYYLAFMG